MMKTSWQTPHNCDKIEAGARDNFHVNDYLGPSAIHENDGFTVEYYAADAMHNLYLLLQSIIPSDPIIAAKCDTISVTTF